MCTLLYTRIVWLRIVGVKCTLGRVSLILNAWSVDTTLWHVVWTCWSSSVTASW
jgi:hypothetical protein